MKIAMNQVGNLEGWLKDVAKKNPAKAIKLWTEIAEFAEAKKSRDSKPLGQTNIAINMVPAQKSQDVIEIEEKEIAKLNTENAPPSPEEGS